MREQADPDGDRQHADDAADPGRREPRTQHRRGPVERVAPDPQHQQHEPEIDRFLDIETLEQRGEHARGEQPEREVVRGVAALEQRAREDQQAEPDHAAREVRHLEHGQRQPVTQAHETRVDRRRRAGQEQHDARDEDERTGQLRHDRCEVGGAGASEAAQPAEMAYGFLAREQQRCERQRQQVINESIREQAREQLVPRDLWQRQHDDGLENAETAGNVAHDAGDARDRKHAGERDEVDLRRGRQQRPEDAGRDQQVARRQQHLRDHERAPGCGERPPAPFDRALAVRSPDDVRQHRAHEQRTHGPRQHSLRVQQRRRLLGREEQREPRRPSRGRYHSSVSRSPRPWRSPSPRVRRRSRAGSAAHRQSARRDSGCDRPSRR